MFLWFRLFNISGASEKSFGSFDVGIPQVTVKGSCLHFPVFGARRPQWLRVCLYVRCECTIR
jgi:hypothetical protein